MLLHDETNRGYMGERQLAGATGFLFKDLALGTEKRERRLSRIVEG